MLARDTPIVDHTANDQTLHGHIQAGDWPDVAAALRRYDERGQRVRLGWLNLDQATELARYLRPGGRGGGRPGPLRPVVEDVLRAKLDPVYAAALRSRDPGTLVLVLDRYDEPDLLLRARQILSVGGVSLVSACDGYATTYYGGANHPVARTLNFLWHEPQTGAAARPPAPAPMSFRNRVDPAVPVPGGKVDTYDVVDDVTKGAAGKGSFGLVYQGAEAPNTGWLQFGAREAEMFDATNGSLGFETSVTAPIKGQPERLRWSKPSAQWWHIDAGVDNPFYEGVRQQGNSGAHSTSPTETAIFDRPDPGTVAVRAAFKNKGVAKVVERVKLHAYLVRGMSVLYENLVIVEFTSFTKNDAPQRRNIAGRGGEVTRLLPEHDDALLRRFPTWRFYRRD